jgi:type II secretory pathway pseudopilin PulG
MIPHSSFDMKFSPRGSGAFTLIEVVAAITVLALIVSTSLVIINNCLEASINLRLRMSAFGLARENMEKLLGAAAVSEFVDYGDSNDTQGMSWETRIEPFYESHTARMWIQAVSSASWYDTGNQLQKIEFTQWLTDLTKEDIGRIIDRRQRQQEALDQDMIAQVQDLYKKALAARDAADTKGYADMVELCRQIIDDYPLTTTANDARALLRSMPQAVQRVFEVKPSETMPVTPSVDTSDISAVAGDTTDETPSPDQQPESGEPDK